MCVIKPPRFASYSFRHWILEVVRFTNKEALLQKKLWWELGRWIIIGDYPLTVKKAQNTKNICARCNRK